MVRLELCEARAEHVEADGLLVPVDGQICRLGGASAAALRSALTPDERDDEREYVGHERRRQGADRPRVVGHRGPEERVEPPLFDARRRR